MTDVPTFVDLQGFIVGNCFYAKEVAVLRQGYILSHYVFECPVPWRLLSRAEKSQATWLIANHHGLLWEDGNIPYSMAKRLITMAITGAVKEDSSRLVYVKGPEKRRWLEELLDQDVRGDLTIETIDTEFEDVASLEKLDVANTLRCKYHVQHCALQNICKLYNWWSNHQK